MPNKINQAFILAAGRGKRMLDLTNDKPKPLVTVANKCLIDYNVEHVQHAGIDNCVVNLCYKGDMIKDHLTSTYPNFNFIFSEEDEALETGGGIKHALPKMKREAFFVINSDALWLDSPGKNLLTNMMNAWDPEKYDMMLMLQPLDKAQGASGNGDYSIVDNRPVRRTTPDIKVPYLYGGVLICHPCVFDNEPEGKYWLIGIFDRLQRENRLGFYINDGEWFHVGDPKAREIAEEKLGKK